MVQIQKNSLQKFQTGYDSIPEDVRIFGGCNPGLLKNRDKKKGWDTGLPNIIIKFPLLCILLEWPSLKKSQKMHDGETTSSSFDVF